MFHLGPIHWAAESHLLELVKLVVSAGADPFLRDAAGKYAWSFVFPPSREESGEILKYLLDLGIPVNEPLSHGVPPFGEWCTADSVTPEILELFLDHGLDLTLEIKGRSLLKIALACAKPAIIECLQRRGLLPNK